MYNNILVPVAFGENKDTRIRTALEIAQGLSAPEARITFLHVMEEMPGYVQTYLPADYSAQARSALEAEIEAIAKDVPNASGRVVNGHSARTILDWAEANDVDLIVVASHRPGMQDLLLGSTAGQIVRHAQCAVHVLR